MRAQHTHMGVRSNSDIIMDPDVVSQLNNFHEDQEADHETRSRWKRGLEHLRDRAKRRNPTHVYIPTNVAGSHWILLHIALPHDTIKVYDSSDAPESHQALAQRVATWWTKNNEWQHGEDSEDNLEIRTNTKCVRQDDDYNCGPMVCLNLRRLMLHRKPPRTRTQWGYDSSQLHELRWHIINELATNSIRAIDDIQR